LQQWLLCSVQGEQAACSASTLALVRRGSKQQGGEQRWGVFLQQQLKAASSVQQATSEKQRLEQARAEQRQGAGNLFDELLSRGRHSSAG